MALDKTKQEEYEFYLKLGQSGVLKIIIDDIPPEASEEDLFDVPPPPSKKALPDDHIPEDENIPIKRGNWDFYDLATRLRSVSVASDFTNGFRPMSATDSPSTDPTKILEYVEIDFDAVGKFDILQGVDMPATGEWDVYALGSNHLQIDIVNESVLSLWDKACLGLSEGDTLDPFGSTKLDVDKSRSIPHCMPLWYGPDAQPSDINTYTQSFGYNDDIFDIELYNDDNIQTWPNTKVREIVQDIRKTGRTSSIPLRQTVWDAMIKKANPAWQATLDKDGNYENERKDYEIWNPLNLSQNGHDISKRGLMKKIPPPVGSGHLRVNSRLVYESFDTGDTVNYKVTTQPSFDADEAVLFVTTKTPIKFYLKPQWLGFCREGSYNYYNPFTYQTYRIGTSGFWGPEYKWVNNQGSFWDQLSFGTAFSGQGDLTMTFSGVGSNEPTYDLNGPVFNFGSINFDCQTGAWNIGVEIVGGIGSVDFSGTAIFRPNNVSPSFPGWWDISNAGFGWTLPPSGPGLRIGNFRIWAIWPQYVGSGPFPSGPTTPLAFTGSIYDQLNIFDKHYAFPAWTTVNTSLSSSIEIFRGCHVGRYPIFPRTISSGEWSGPFFNENPSTWTFEDGSSKTYIPADAIAMYGRVLYWEAGGSADNNRQFYERHASRDTQEVAKRIYPFDGGYPPETRNDPFSVDPVIGGRATWKQVFSIGQGKATWDALFDSEAETIKATYEAQTQVRNVITSVPSSSNYDEWGTIHMLPINARVGRLCAVIVVRGTKYYIWGKTAQARGGFDYDRNQAVTYYNGTLD